MNTFVTCVGWFVLAMLSIGIACGMVCAVIYLYDKAMERFEWSVASKTRLAIGRSIGSSAWWFSESPDTSLALRLLAERITDGTGIDPIKWRAEWQKGRAAPASEEPRS